MADNAPPLGRIMIPNVRLSYFHGFKPYASDKDIADGKQPQYQTRALLPLDRNNEINLITKTIKQVMEEKWKGNQPNLPKERYFIRKGSAAKPGDENYKDMWLLALNAQTDQPQLILPDKTPATESDLYSGCWANVIFTVWAQDSKEHGKRVNAKWNAAMFHHHDTHWAGAPPVTDNEWGEELKGDEWGGDGSGVGEEQTAGVLDFDSDNSNPFG